MTDKELLEAAARASGIEFEKRYEEPSHFRGLLLQSWRAPYTMAFWNPLTDDGDALRLAVKLSINIVPNYYAEWHNADGSVVREFTTEAGDSDNFAATRRAIVRVAAEIGSSHNA